MNVYQDLTDFPAGHYLQVNSCGTEGNTGPAYTLLRPNGRSDYYMFYVAAGWLEIEADGEMIRITEGQCVLCMPNVKQKINYPSDWQLRCHYVHFTGEFATEMLKEINLQKITIFSIEDTTMFELLFRRLAESFRMEYLQGDGSSVCSLRVNGQLIQLLAIVKQAGEEKEEQDAILPAIFYITEHFREDIDLKLCAAQIHLSVSRFSHLFTEKTGISPHRFIVSLRIDKAKELLMYSSMSVAEISRHVGFEDASYFSRIFRKYTGHTPMEYRRKCP